MPEAFVQLPEAERIALTLSAQAKGVPLTDRWSQLDPAVSNDWHFRSRHAVKWLEDAASIADLGCGHMLLETLLRPDQIYIPVDCVPRGDRSILVDFNTQKLPRLGATHFAALGLFEYLYDLEGFVRSLRANFTAGVASFFTRRPNVPEKQRLATGWVNHQTAGDMLALFDRAGFKVSETLEFRPAHFLYRLD